MQKDLKEGTPPSANMISCPNCKYYPQDVQDAVGAHEKQHMKQIAEMGLVPAAACSAVAICRREMEADAYRAESKVVDKRLSELQAKESKGELSPEDKTSQRVLREMQTQEREFFRNPSLLDGK